MSSTAPEEDKKPDHINLKVCGQGSDGDIFFKIKKTTPFAKLFAAYCEKTGKSVNSIRFMFDGERLLPTDTPEKVCCLLCGLACISLRFLFGV